MRKIFSLLAASLPFMAALYFPASFAGTEVAPNFRIPITLTDPDNIHLPGGAIPTAPKPTLPTNKSSIMDWNLGTGNWFGLRNTLHDKGIDIVGHYVDEFAGNPIGGVSKGVDDAREINVVATFDLDRLLGMKDSLFTMVILKRSGTSLSVGKVHNLGSIQEIWGGGLDYRLSEMSYTKTFSKSDTQIKVGWAPPGNDYATDPLNCDYMNNVFCGHTIGLSNNNNFRNYPTGKWGARIRQWLTRKIYGQIGIYRGNPNDGPHGKGFDTNFSGKGMLLPVEVGWKTITYNLPAFYKVGFLLDTSSNPDVVKDIHGNNAGATGSPFLQHEGRWTAYGLIDHALYREKVGDAHGLTLIAALAYSDPDTARFTYTATAGIVQQGIGTRRNDYVAIGTGILVLNSRSALYREARIAHHGSVGPPQTKETIIEADYGMQIAPWALFRPNFQYILKPGGVSNIPNAAAFGATFKFTL